MSRQEALRNDLKALEWLRDRLHAQWSESRRAGDVQKQDAETATRDPNKVNEVEFADPRRVFRN